MLEKRNLRVSYASEISSALKLKNEMAVMIDVLRASSTICAALAAGAKEVIPFKSVAEAKRVKAKLGEAAVLAGERKGLKVPGFDAGNSPAEFTPETVKRKTLLLATTNGTQALLKASFATKAYVGCLLNERAVSLALLKGKGPIRLIPAGFEGLWSADDFYCAGSIVSTLLELGGRGRFALDDSAAIASEFFQALMGKARQVLSTSRSGQPLFALGYEADIEYCAEMDILRLVPEMKSNPIRIVATRA